MHLAGVWDQFSTTIFCRPSQELSAIGNFVVVDNLTCLQLGTCLATSLRKESYFKRDKKTWNFISIVILIIHPSILIIFDNHDDDLQVLMGNWGTFLQSRRGALPGARWVTHWKIILLIMIILFNMNIMIIVVIMIIMIIIRIQQIARPGARYVTHWKYSQSAWSLS